MDLITATPRSADFAGGRSSHASASNKGKAYGRAENGQPTGARLSALWNSVRKSSSSRDLRRQNAAGGSSAPASASLHPEVIFDGPATMVPIASSSSSSLSSAPPGSRTFPRTDASHLSTSASDGAFQSRKRTLSHAARSEWSGSASAGPSSGKRRPVPFHGDAQMEEVEASDPFYVPYRGPISAPSSRVTYPSPTPVPRIPLPPTPVSAEGRGSAMAFSEYHAQHPPTVDTDSSTTGHLDFNFPSPPPHKTFHSTKPRASRASPIPPPVPPKDDRPHPYSAARGVDSIKASQSDRHGLYLRSGASSRSQANGLASNSTSRAPPFPASYSAPHGFAASASASGSAQRTPHPAIAPSFDSSLPTAYNHDGSGYAPLSSIQPSNSNSLNLPAAMRLDETAAKSSFDLAGAGSGVDRRLYNRLQTLRPAGITAPSGAQPHISAASEQATAPAPSTSTYGIHPGFGRETAPAVPAATDPIDSSPALAYSAQVGQRARAHTTGGTWTGRTSTSAPAIAPMSTAASSPTFDSREVLQHDRREKDKGSGYESTGTAVSASGGEDGATTSTRTSMTSLRSTPAMRQASFAQAAAESRHQKNASSSASGSSFATSRSQHQQQQQLDKAQRTRQMTASTSASGASSMRRLRRDSGASDSNQTPSEHSSSNSGHAAPGTLSILPVPHPLLRRASAEPGLTIIPASPTTNDVLAAAQQRQPQQLDARTFASLAPHLSTIAPSTSSISRPGSDAGARTIAQRWSLLSGEQEVLQEERAPHSMPLPQPADMSDMEAAQRRERVLHQIHLDELNGHTSFLEVGGVFETEGSCDSVFFPKPRLRTRTNSGSSATDDAIFERFRSQQHSPVARLGRSASSPMLNHASNPGPQNLRAGTPGAGEGLMRPNMSETQLHRHTESAGPRPTITRMSTSSSTPQFFHHRPAPPVPQHRAHASSSSSGGRPSRSSFGALRALSTRPSIDALRESLGGRSRADNRSRSHTLSSMHDASSIYQLKRFEFEEPPLDLPTVIAQGAELDRERARWRDEFGNSIGTRNLRAHSSSLSGMTSGDALAARDRRFNSVRHGDARQTATDYGSIPRQSNALRLARPSKSDRDLRTAARDTSPTITSCTAFRSSSSRPSEKPPSKGRLRTVSSTFFRKVSEGLRQASFARETDKTVESTETARGTRTEQVVQRT